MTTYRGLTQYYRPRRTAGILPESAEEILVAAARRAKMTDDEALRAEILDRATDQVKQRYPQFFKEGK